MLGADTLDEGVVSFEGGIILDARAERLAFEDVPSGMAVALGFGAVQGVLDHCPTKESSRERLLVFEGFGSGIEKEIDVAVALGAALEHEPGGVSLLLPVDEESESGGEIRERESVVESLLLSQHIFEIRQRLQVGAEVVAIKPALEAAPAEALGLVASVGRKQGLDPGQLPIHR